MTQDTDFLLRLCRYKLGLKPPKEESMPKVNLDPELVEMMTAVPQPIAIAMTMNNGKPSIVIKAENDMVLTLVRPGIVVLFRPEMYLYPAGAVFRFFGDFMHTPEVGYSFDSFLNVEDNFDRNVITAFTRFPFIHFHIFNMLMQHVGSKQINWNEGARADLWKMMRMALKHNADARKAGTFDYAQAKAALIEDLQTKADTE